MRTAVKVEARPSVGVSWQRLCAGAKAELSGALIQGDQKGTRIMQTMHLMT